MRGVILSCGSNLSIARTVLRILTHLHCTVVFIQAVELRHLQPWQAAAPAALLGLQLRNALRHALPPGQGYVPLHYIIQNIHLIYAVYMEQLKKSNDLQTSCPELFSESIGRQLFAGAVPTSNRVWSCIPTFISWLISCILIYFYNYIAKYMYIYRCPWVGYPGGDARKRETARHHHCAPLLLLLPTSGAR